MATPARRPRGPYGIEPKPKKKRVRPTGRRKPAPPAPAPKRRLDAYHLLSLVAGAFTGLVIYSLVTPTHVPSQQPPGLASRKSELQLVQVAGAPGQDGLFHVRGQIVNQSDVPCKLASVQIHFFDRGGRVVTKTLAVAENIGVQGAKPFTARVFAKGAVTYEVAVDLAQF